MSSLEPISSGRLDEAFYDRLAAMRAEAAAFGQANDPAVVLDAQAFVNREARLLDCRNFDAWLGLFADPCVYWLPTDEFADPRTAVSLWLDDRRRLEDRLTRFHTGFAFSQVPDRRLRRIIGNVEAYESATGKVRRILSNQAVYEHRTGYPVITHVAQVDHLLHRHSDGWQIAVKRCVLLNAPDYFELPTLL